MKDLGGIGSEEAKVNKARFVCQQNFRGPCDVNFDFDLCRIRLLLFFSSNRNFLRLFQDAKIAQVEAETEVRLQQEPETRQEEPGADQKE